MTIIFNNKTSLYSFLFFVCFFNASLSQTQTESAEIYLNSLYKFMYTNKDSTQYYKQKLIDLSIKNNNNQDLISTYLVSNRSNLVFNDVEGLKHNLTKIDSLISIEEKNIEKTDDFEEVKNFFLHDKAAYFYKLNDYAKAKENLNLLFISSNKIPDSLLKETHRHLIDVSYKFMAKIHSNSEEYEQALQYLNKSIRYINLASISSKDYLLHAAYRQKSEIYKKLRNYKKANFYGIKALNHGLANNQTNTNQLINEVNNVTNNYIALKQYDSAVYYLDIIKPYADNNIPYGHLYYKSKAKLDEVSDNKNQVEGHYKKTLQLLDKKWKGLKQIEIAETLQAFSNFSINNDDLTKATKQNTSAIRQVTGKEVVNSTINKITLFKLLQQKAVIQSHLNQSDSVIKTTYQATKLLDSLKPNFKSKTDKLLLIENAYTVFENGLEATYNSYSSNNKNAINDAFFFLEKSKSTLLLEALLGTKAESFTNIPNDVLTKEQIYKTTITDLEKQLNQRQSDALKDQLFNKKIEYRQFLDTLENNYKDYYKLKYGTEVLTLKNLQNNLEEHEAVVTYFYGNRSIFCLAISKDNLDFNKIAVTKVLEQQIRSFQKQVSNPKSDLNKLTSNAKQLYKILLSKGLENNSIKKLTILPDGLLTYIPFEALIKNDDYLVNNYAISYSNSVTLLNELKSKKETKNNLLAFAPEFNGIITNSNLRSSLQPLPHNKTEIKNINNYYKGNLYSNTNASLENFKTNASNYGLIHLATHAIFNDTNPEYSYLAFGNDESDLLYTADLYNLNLNANLVTLSACESGIGELKRGEGLLSLARGFYFSGAQSISSTLWKINDASSSKLMTNFYSNLSKGQTKNIALQQAKLSFIKENKDNALSHPYYWSGFIISGNPEALSSTNYALWIVLGAIGLLFLIFFLRRKN